ncbi:hypothetical protein [Coleofasciculus sp. FACHB-129]|nr:hypothetical protein [Coleofasciculus sp. FACHB-129]
MSDTRQSASVFAEDTSFASLSRNPDTVTVVSGKAFVVASSLNQQGGNR